MPPAHALRRRVRSPATFYAFGTAVFIYRDLLITGAPRVLLDSARVSVMLMFSICNAFLFGLAMAPAGICPGSRATTLNVLHLAQGFGHLVR